MEDAKTLFNWLDQKKLIAVSFSWRFGKGSEPDKLMWIGTHRKEKKDERRTDAPNLGQARVD